MNIENDSSAFQFPKALLHLANGKTPMDPTENSKSAQPTQELINYVLQTSISISKILIF